MSAPSHYQRLGLSIEASPEQLHQAFRRLSKCYHPDTTNMPPLEAEEAFRELQLAYGVLSDPLQRQRYDAALRAQAVAAVLLPAQPMPSPSASRRPLSGGEWLALLLLAAAALFSLVLGVGLAWLRGVDLIEWPSWWLEGQ
jgi:curved DNA-binding protein CbpA